MPQTIKKALIPVAGLGTRFLPVTATIPKEMLPIVDEPTLLFNIREIVDSGIEDVVLVCGRHKHAIEDFFDHQVELEKVLEEKGKLDLLDRLTELRDKVNIISIRQKEALGLGHAVLCGAPIIGNDPFAVLLGDELMLTKEGHPPVTKQLCQHYEKTGRSAVAIMEVPPSEVSKYGIVGGKKEDDYVRIEQVVEKPDVDSAPSSWALPGRYVFSAKIFAHLRQTKPGKNGEIQLTDAMEALAADQALDGHFFVGDRHDAGDKLGYLKANIEMGLRHPQVAQGLKDYIIHLSKELS